MIKEAIAGLIQGQSLSAEEAAAVMAEIMDGEATPAQFGAFVTALRIKGETVEEIVGLARTMRARAVPVKVSAPVVDTCGTGGDGAGTFNISTAAAFVAAGAGLTVAKHGNRAMSSKCGSADVLEALGVKIDLNAAQVQRCLEEVGISFMFAPVFHPAMKYAAAPRREIGIRTIFNVLGPLTNPAGARAQMLGVADRSLLEKMAAALQGLGCERAFVVHGADGLDEITVTGITHVAELKNGSVYNYTLSPEEMNLPAARPDSLSGGTAAENAETLLRIFRGTPGPRADAVIANAAAVLVAGGKAADLKQGVKMAEETINTGKAREKLERLVAFSREAAP
jgi:anthranilate phosphoribosyltransferase